MSQQQVTPQQMVHQIGHMNPHSESAMLSQQVPNLQSHRPHVPHSGREFSPQKNAQSVPVNPASHGAATSQQGSGGGNAFEQMGEQGNGKNEMSQPSVEEDTYERQPVGGRNAVLYRQLMMNNRQQQGQQQHSPPQFPGDNSVAMNQFANNPHGYNHVLTCANPLQNPQNSPLQNPQSVQDPQQLYQQMQQNMAQQQQMQQRAMNYQMQMMRNQRCLTAPPNYSGMTSPQDAIATQMRNLRMVGSNYPVQDHNTVNAANGLYRNSNSTNNANNTATTASNSNSNQLAEYSSVKAQLKSYNVDVVNGNQTLYRPQNQQQHQFMPHYQPEIGYQQQMQPQQQMQQMQAQQIPFQQQLYRNPVMQGHQNMMVYNQPGYNQQISPGQQMIPMIQQQNLENNPERVQGQHGRKRALKFTHGMIRDQEKLLATMKQQRVPIDIMKRQFETLLNEQRKHLEYLGHQDNMLEEMKPVVVTRKRKQQDEKPEWMIHLTPPRLSYLEIERMQEQRRKERESHEMEMMQQQQQQQQQQYQTMDEMSRQQVPVQAINQQNYQHYRQQANWQQQQKTSRQYNSARPYAVPGPGNVNESIKTMKYQQQNVPPQYHQYQQSHHLQPYQHAHHHLQPHQEYYNPQQYQQYQQYYQALTQQQNREHVQPIATNQLPLYEDQNRPSTEPSSLLKIRRYRNEIRPQRRNNGLQEPEIAKRQLEEFRISAEIRKGLEYIANLAPKKRVVRLNGMQESNELDSQFQQRLITSALSQSVQRISANGLENTRNPNNPPSQRLSNLKKMEHEYLREYPRQKQNNPRTCYSVPAERENGSMAMDQQQQQQLQQMQHQMLSQQQFPAAQNSSKSLPYNERNQLLPRVNTTSYRFDANYPQHYQQMQQYYQNSKNLARNHGEGDMGSAQRIEQNKGNFDHAGGDASENMNNTTMNGQMADGKIPYQRIYYSQPDIHESRTIGGVRYLARKQDYMPNQ